MFTHCNLVVLIFVLILQDQVYTGEIIGGREVVPHSKPYMVLLELHNLGGHNKHCDGFLVNEDFVLTAGHCHAKSYKVFLGLHDYHNHNGVQHVSVPETNAFPHKDYNPVSYSNDIMLLKLSTKAVFNENVKPIDLADRDDGFAPKSCVVPGWGNTGNGKDSDVLLEVNVTLTENEICAKENKYCSEGATGPSTGDSGGPLVCEDGKAYGVVSASSNSMLDGLKLYSYIKISDKRDWIDSVIDHHRKW
uniref:trypsin n=1 Tax=Maylandia zebra TaxID=106582 RepID=A0A3P9BVF1_9CICH|nr:granzyme B [Maylandia zebra]